MTRLICLDIDGTITDGIVGAPFPGAAEAIRRVSERYPVRFVTNATSVSHQQIATHLEGLGVLDDPSHLVTPLELAKQVLLERNHASGILLADAGARAQLDWFVEDPGGASVLVASEGFELRIADLQPAFRLLHSHGAALYCLQKNRYFQLHGELVTDLGPLVSFLEYAADTTAELFGKPSPLLFDRLAREVGAARVDIVMVGDDAQFDVAASVEMGMRGVLVRTGKYREGDETKVSPAPSATLAALADLPDYLGL